MASRYFHWDVVGDCVMHETDGAGVSLVTYTHEPGAYGPLISENRGGATSTHRYDALGSTTMLTDDTGAVTDTFQYDAWGNQMARTGTKPTPYTWVGRWGYQDDQLSAGRYYIRARSYEPLCARWMSADPSTNDNPFLFIDGSYIYDDNRAVMYTDRTGMKPDEEDSKAAKGKNPPGAFVKCKKNKQVCIDAMLKQMKAFLGKNNDCFNRSQKPEQASETEKDCRSKLTACILAAIDHIKVGCAYHDNAISHASGSCAELRDRARANKCKEEKDCSGKPEADPSCGPCPRGLMKTSWIDIVDTDATNRIWNHPNSDVPSGWCNLATPGGQDNVHNLYMGILHEFLHHCVGGHTGTPDHKMYPPQPNDECSRPDVTTLVKDYEQNCWKNRPFVPVNP